MSLLIAHVTKERALIAADTESSAAQLDSGPRRESAKLLLLPHISAAVATIGNMDLLTLFASMVMRAGSFDEIFDAIAGGLIDECGWHLDSMATREGFIVRDQQVVAIAGFSTAHKAMRLIVAERTNRVDGFFVAACRTIVAPLVPGTPGSPERIREIAAAQVAQTRRDIPECPIGGYLILADITRDRMTIERTAL